MQILLVGLGSIGTRHLNNILALGYKNVALVSSKTQLPQAFQQLKVYSNIETAVSENQFTTAIICVPTAQHITALQSCLQAGIMHIYLEKPISHNYQNVNNILAQFPQANIYVGFDMHYDLGLQKVKALLQQNTIGNVVAVNAQVGQYLPDWRPQEDYTKGMSAKRETGGGVLLDLVHEFDYLYWLIGEVDTIACIYKNSGSLQIETEDVAEVLLYFKNGVIGTIHLDYLQQKLVRNCLITGTSGSITWNLSASTVQWITANKEMQEYSYAGFERNDRFMNIMNDFLLQQQNQLTTNFSQGLQSLKMVLAAKYSSENRVFVKMNEFNPS